jgi:Mrp family chromosome partitioning ATPase
MFTSAAGDDGKLEVVANLAMSLARGHRRVSLVDFDLRDPALGQVFRVNAPYGLTDVISGRALLEEALVRVRVAIERTTASQRSSTKGPRVSGQPRQGAARSQGASGRGPAARTGKPGGLERSGRAGRTGQLAILASGLASSQDEDLVDTEIVATLLSDLRETSDLVIINAPPLLEASDSVVLATMVDAIVMVAGLQQTNRSDLLAVRQLFGTMSAPRLGVVLTEAPDAVPTYQRRALNALRAWILSGTARRSSDAPSALRP